MSERRIPGRQVPFFRRTEPHAVPQILASEVGQQKTAGILAASLVKAVKPGQVLGRLDATNELIPAKIALIATTVADGTAVSALVLDDASPFAAGDVLTIVGGTSTVTKTILSIATNTVTFTAALGAQAFNEGARVSTTALLGGSAVAIAAQYAAGGTGNTVAPLEDAIAYQQQMEVFRAGRFKRLMLHGWNTAVQSDFGAHIQLAAIGGEQFGQDPIDVVVIP